MKKEANTKYNGLKKAKKIKTFGNFGASKINPLKKHLQIKSGTTGI